MAHTVTTIRQSHWLRRNAANRTPRRVIFLDVESRRTQQELSQRHGFRCAVASFETLAESGLPNDDTTWLETENAAELWWFVADFTNTQHRTVLFAHNLSVDLRLGQALHQLPAQGFQCTGIALTNFSCWARFKNGTRSLWLCDTLSFIPKPLEQIAADLRVEKPSLPKHDATPEEWMARCRADTEVTREAMLRVIRYIKVNDLGDFRLTGAAQCTAAFRHRFLPPKTLLVHEDTTALEKERTAAWAGRAEVWRHGDYAKPVYEYDYEQAYARLAYENTVPTRYITTHSGVPWKRLELVMNSYSVCADISVTTQVPCVPTVKNGGIVWPVGSFRTTLWDNELRLAKSEGAEIEVHRYWYYKRAPLLREWAKWILHTLSQPGVELDPVVRTMLKDWSRALIGRFGLRYTTIEEIASLSSNELRLFGVHDADTGKELEYLQLGSQLFERMGREEAPNSTPAVMSYIMAAGRVKLWNAMKAVGLENILYVDTDGFIVTGAGHRTARVAIARGELPGLRLKSSYQGGNFRAPRNIDLGETRRVSGAPRKAERLSSGVYRGEVWQSLPTALRHGNANVVLISDRTFQVGDTDKRRIHCDDGSTEPHRLCIEQTEETCKALDSSH